MLVDIRALKKEMDAAYLRFEYGEDDDSVEAAIYELESLKRRYHRLLKLAKQEGMKTVLIIFLAAAALAITVFAVTNRRGFSALILNAIGGAAALFAVNIAGLATGIQLSVNRWSLGAGALLGVPGVISMLVLDIVFK